MTHTTIFQMNEEDFKRAIADQLAEMQRSALLGQFAGRMVGVDTVAEIHDVHRDTVLRYAKAGLIACEHKGRLWKFQLSEVLGINFQELKKKM